MTRGEQAGIAELRERLTRMETSYTHMQASVDRIENAVGGHIDRIETTITDANKKIAELHDLHMKAKGARWALGGLVTIAAGAIGWLSNHLTAFFPK